MKKRFTPTREKRENPKPQSKSVTEATIVKVNSTYGFARPADGQSADVFISGRQLMGAMPGDKVEIRTRPGKGELLEGEVIRITQPADPTFTGIYYQEDGKDVIHPDKLFRFPIVIAKGKTAGARAGEKVLAVIQKRGTSHFEHRAAITKVFGAADRAASCCEAVLAAADMRRFFPAAVVTEADRLQQAGIHPKELEARLDLRDEMIFTIDGADTKDIDDAISLSKSAEGWRLGVHIADVSYYVTPGSELDTEAYRRGTSVYFADSVIPMLPPALSNGICSLNPNEDRLAFSALMELDAAGDIQSFRFQKTVIRSRIKGVYSEINAIFDGTATKEVNTKYALMLPTLSLMRELAALLDRKKRARGAVDLASSESKFVLDAQGRVTEILRRHQGESENMIEEFMLTANQCAALFGEREELPFVYRVHEPPAADRVAALGELLRQLGLPALRPDNAGTIDSPQLATVLKEVKGTPLEQVVNHQVLRSMAKAKYEPQCIGHFGLVLKHYSHFTSPIRRYPDLVIHRIMSAKLTGMRRDNIEKRYRNFVVDAAAQSTATEIAAMTAERDCEAIYRAEYMQSRVGQTFEGVISSIAPHGIYVELPNTVEGLIHLDNLPAGEYTIPSPIELNDRRSGRNYRIGAAITVEVLSANVSAGQVDFKLPGVEVGANAAPYGGRERALPVAGTPANKPGFQPKAQSQSADSYQRPPRQDRRGPKSGSKNAGPKNSGFKSSGGKTAGGSQKGAPKSASQKSGYKKPKPSQKRP